MIAVETGACLEVLLRAWPSPWKRQGNQVESLASRLVLETVYSDPACPSPVVTLLTLSCHGL